MTARPNDLRRSIAAIAARLVVEEGIEDFGQAKRKAARQAGVTESESLPNNAEIEQALREYQALFHDEEHDDRLRAMRETAVLVMRMLLPWHSYLTGMVLDGTASAFSEVELEVYADSGKDVEIFLLGRNIDYEHREVRQTGHDAPEVILAFDYEDVPVRLRVYNSVAERTPRRSHGHGRSHERARIEAVEAMLVATRSAEGEETGP